MFQKPCFNPNSPFFAAVLRSREAFYTKKRIHRPRHDNRTYTFFGGIIIGPRSEWWGLGSFASFRKVTPRFGYDGVMVWAIEKDFKKYRAEPSHDMLYRYVPTGTTGLLAGPSFRGAREEMLSMTISNGGDKGQAVFRYLVPSAAAFSDAIVSLGIYGTDGRVVKTLVHEKSAPGTYSIELNGSGSRVRPGAYVVKLSAGGAPASARTLIVK